MNIVFIGSGNLATSMSMEMQRAGMTISQVYSRSRSNAEALAKKINSSWTSHINEIMPDADLYVFALKDDALREVVSQVKPNEGLWIHTAGSVPMDIFEGYAKRYGVFYPLQTFTKNKRVKLEGTPIFLEVKDTEDMKLLRKVAIALSGNAQEIDSEKRKRLHLAAVFACNFVNHMYVLAGKILEEQGIPYRVLLPLMTETVEKINEIPPLQAQTGPAVRFDKEIMDKQLEMLTDPSMQTIYRLISQNIYKESLQYEPY